MPIDPTPYIEHTLLDNTATPDRIEQLCAEAIKYKFPAVCVYPCYVRQARELLNREKTTVTTVIGFPTGAHTKEVKLYEAQLAIHQGAQELDVVLNLGLIKAGRSEALYQEIAPICEDKNIPVKAILEMPLLTPSEWELAVEVCLSAGVQYLKTCTGWHGSVTLAQVQYLYQRTKGKVGIKAAGGIRSLAQAQDLINSGATRLGTSHGLRILEELSESQEL
ncbi:MAG: deoxyribose-phosphate aldolase [Pseudanabaenaceae cyanobacterium]